jgi:putative tryptophan/tyrosine transport system substrate-binding protein
MGRDRRRFVLGAAALAVAHLAHAQPAVRIRTIGYLTPAGKPALRDEVFRQRLKELGWIEGKNLRIEYRRSGNDPKLLRKLAEELVRLQVELIVAQSTPAVQAAKAATTSIPVVSLSADPVANRFVDSLGRPGGNITGLSMMMPALAGKRMELLRDLMPKLSRVGFLGHGADPSHKLFAKEAEDAGRRLGIDVRAYIVDGEKEFTRAFEAMKHDGIEALIVQPLFVNTLGATAAIVKQAAELKLATISDGERFAHAGGLVFHGPDPLVMYNRLAVYVDRVLKGGKPADMPMEQPQKFLTVINLATAKTLGIAVRQSLLMRADQVIE